MTTVERPVARTTPTVPADQADPWAAPRPMTSYERYLDRIAHPTEYDRWQERRAEEIAERYLWE